MCRDLRNLVNKWVKGDTDIVSHIIATFGVECDCTGKGGSKIRWTPYPAKTAFLLWNILRSQDFV